MVPRSHLGILRCPTPSVFITLKGCYFFLKHLGTPLKHALVYPHELEGVSLTTVILASGAENLGTEVPAPHHFQFIRFIRFQIPSGSQTV